MGSGMVPLDKALLSTYRLSAVTTTVWSQFAMQILTKNLDLQIRFPRRTGDPVDLCYLGLSLPSGISFLPSNGFNRLHE